MTRPVLTEPEPVEEGPTVHSGAGEGGGVAEGRSQGKKGGGERAPRDEPPWVPAPVTWAPDPAAAGRCAGGSVSWSVGQ